MLHFCSAAFIKQELLLLLLLITGKTRLRQNGISWNANAILPLPLSH